MAKKKKKKPSMYKDLDEGAFTRKAKAHKMTVQQFASEVLSNPEDYPEKTRKQAQFAKTQKKIARKHKRK